MSSENKDILLHKPQVLCVCVAWGAKNDFRITALGENFKDSFALAGKFFDKTDIFQE